MDTEFNGLKNKRDHCVNGATEAWISEKENASRVIKDFGSYTTLHGFHFILDSGSLIRRIIWITLILLGLAFLFLQFRDNYRKFTSNEIVISKGLERNKKLLYPAITICNQNMMRKSRILGTDAQTFLDQQDHLKIQFQGESLYHQDTDPSFNIEESVKNNSHDLSEMLKMCEWGNHPCSPTNFTPVLSYMVRLNRGYYKGSLGGGGGV